MRVSRRTLLGGLLAAAGALSCGSGGADPLPPRELPSYLRVPRVAFGALGLAHLERARLRVYDPGTGAVVRERPLSEGLAITTLADGSFLAVDRAPGGLVLHQLGPGVDLRLEPAQTGALSTDVGLLLPHPADPRRFRLLDSAQHGVVQGSLDLLAGRIALDAALTLQRSMPGPLLAAADGSLLWFEAGALYRVAVRTGATAERLPWTGPPLVRLARGQGSELWGANAEGKISRFSLGSSVSVAQTLETRLGLEDLDAGPDGLAVLGREAPGGLKDARILIHLAASGDERARWTLDRAGEPSLVLGSGPSLAVERGGELLLFEPGSPAPRVLSP